MSLSVVRVVLGLGALLAWNSSGFAHPYSVHTGGWGNVHGHDDGYYDYGPRGYYRGGWGGSNVIINVPVGRQ